MGVTMFLQQKLNPPPPDPVQARMFQFMPIIFTFMLASFPAGLVIYWSWNNLLSIAQQWLIMRRTRLARAGAGAHLTDDEAALEAGRLLFAAECRFFFAAQRLDQLPPAAGPGGRVRRPIQCRQVVAAECADRTAGAGPGFAASRGARGSSTSSTWAAG